MMLASGQVCYGFSKAGASPLYGVLNWSQLRSAQYANAQHAQRR